jgi:hypothetical protein
MSFVAHAAAARELRESFGRASNEYGEEKMKTEPKHLSAWILAAVASGGLLSACSTNTNDTPSDAAGTCINNEGGPDAPDGSNDATMSQMDHPDAATDSASSPGNEGSPDADAAEHDDGEVNNESGADVDGGADTGLADAGDDSTTDSSDDTAMDANSVEADAPTGTDADAGTSTVQILSARSPTNADGGNACLDCANQARCLDPNLLCEHLGDQITLAGPDAGQSRQRICYATLSCLFDSQCYFVGSGIDGCFCGNESKATCVDAGPPQSPCLDLEEIGLETTDPGMADQVLTYTTLGAGTANALVQCIVNAGCTDCLL